MYVPSTERMHAWLGITLLAQLQKREPKNVLMRRMYVPRNVDGDSICAHCAYVRTYSGCAVCACSSCAKPGLGAKATRVPTNCTSSDYVRMLTVHVQTVPVPPVLVQTVPTVIRSYVRTYECANSLCQLCLCRLCQLFWFRLCQLCLFRLCLCHLCLCRMYVSINTYVRNLGKESAALLYCDVCT